MLLDTVGQTIATRDLLLTNETGESRKVEVLIGKPQPAPDAPVFYCPFQIRGVGSERVKYAAGIDAVQSLQLVMLMIAADLKFLNQENGGGLHWEGGTGGDLGFESP